MLRPRDLLLLLAMGGPLMSSASASEGAVFRLCASNVAQVYLIEESSGVAVHVRLEESAAAEFAELTLALQGKMLSVLAGQQVLSRAIVQIPIDSGLLRSPLLPKAQAAKIRQEIMVRHPPEECGASV